MISLTVLESGGKQISGIITNQLRTLPENSAARGLIIWGKTALQMGLCPDMVVISRTAASKKRDIPYGKCGTLLLPGISADLALRLRCGCAVSYGMSVKDSITVSSMDGDRILLALQRELPTLTGGVLERQEIPLYCPVKQSAYDVMASAAAMLILGIPPERLSDRFPTV